MAIYSKTTGGTKRHGIKGIKTPAGLRVIASLWVKTGRGLVKIYEGIRTCWDGKFWRGDKIWRGDVKW